MNKLESQKGVCNIIVCGLPAPRGPPTPPIGTPHARNCMTQRKHCTSGVTRIPPQGPRRGSPGGGTGTHYYSTYHTRSTPGGIHSFKLFRLCLLVLQLQHLTTVPVDIPVPDVRCDNARMQMKRKEHRFGTST